MIMNIYIFLVSVIMARNSTCVKLHIICRCFSSLLLFYDHVTLRVLRCRPSKGVGGEILTNCSCLSRQDFMNATRAFLPEVGCYENE